MRLALTALTALLLAFPASALASGDNDGHPPRDPCAEHRNPTTLCGPGIEVTAEPPGPNCPTGGIRVVIIRGERDRPVVEDQDGRPNHPDPRDRVFYVCNGRDGEPGEDGEDGETPVITPEPTGLNCPTGGLKITLGQETFYACNGLVGPAGPTGPGGPAGPGGPSGPIGPGGPSGPAGPGGPPPRSCRSTRSNAIWTLIVTRNHRVRNVRVTFEGQRRPSRVQTRETTIAGRRAWRVRINMSGLRRGIYFARVRYRVSVNGGPFRRNTKIHGFRTCYFNVLGGITEGPNRVNVELL